jgi:hypothetical protein
MRHCSFVQGRHEVRCRRYRGRKMELQTNLLQLLYSTVHCMYLVERTRHTHRQTTMHTIVVYVAYRTIRAPPLFQQLSSSAVCYLTISLSLSLSRERERAGSSLDYLVPDDGLPYSTRRCGWMCLASAPVSRVQMPNQFEGNVTLKLRVVVIPCLTLVSCVKTGVNGHHLVAIVKSSKRYIRAGACALLYHPVG